MSIEKVRSSLDSDDLKRFNDVMYNVHLASDVHHDIIGFDDVNNFIIKSKFNTNPSTGLTCVKNGKVVEAICY